MDWNTPLGNTKIVAKTENPSWYPPASIRKEHAEDGDELPAFIPPGPNNPLGNHAIRLGLPGYLIHGTNRPEGVGMRVTHGCIRMFPEDVEYLFKILPVGTQVNLINEPYKAGWLAGKLYFEAHPQLEEEAEQHVKFNYEPVIQAIGHATEYRPARIDRNSLKTLLDEHRGFPGVISRE
jgi:L,D-transpeptidase ErfK/SrfK